MDRHTKIIATIGPKSKSDDVLKKMITAGMDIARLNFSHGTHQDHAETISLIRKVSAEMNKPIPILQDLQGPKMRVGELPSQGYELVEDQTVILAPEEMLDSVLPVTQSFVIPFDVPNLIESLKTGSRVLMDDGNLELEVIAITENSILARVVLGGKLSSHKGVNLPGAPITIPGFTEKDEADLQFGLQHGIDIVAVSFVRSAMDIQIVRDAILKYSPESSHIPIIAKLERPEAIQKLPEIMQIADGVMVARGDLAVETSPAEVPILQKQIIEMANLYSKVVITATQMLDSMIHNPRPTRAEASDVANAIFDGTDVVMLSGESANGAFPVESVEMMASIIRKAEPQYVNWGRCSSDSEGPSLDDAVSITRAARELALDRNVTCIAVFTQTGKIAQLMSKARPNVPILAFTPEPRTYQRLGLYRSVTPFLVPFASSVEQMISIVDHEIISSTHVEAGQQVIVVAGFPVGEMRPPNFALLHTIETS